MSWRDHIAQAIMDGYRAYTADVAPATWKPSPYEDFRQSENVEDRRGEQLSMFDQAFGDLPPMKNAPSYRAEQLQPVTPSQLSRDLGEVDLIKQQMGAVMRGAPR
jgi:hypothetical protein